MPINLHSIDGQNKPGGRISKNVAKIATNWLKMSRAAAFGQSLGGHNLVIFYPILTFDHTKMISSSRRVQWWKDLSSISFRSDFGFLSHFLPPVATWATLGARAQKYPQVVGTCPTYHHQLIAQNQSPRKIRHHTPPLSTLNQTYSAAPRCYLATPDALSI